MDITILFKACVKTVRTRNKSLGAKDTKTDILKKSNRDPYLFKAKEIIKQLTSLKDFLNENKRNYISVSSHFSNHKQLSETDREQIDANATTILQSSTQLVGNLKKHFPKTNLKQQIEHYNNVLVSLETYVKSVGKLYAEHKAIRIKKALDNRKISKLETKLPEGKPKFELLGSEEPLMQPNIPIIPDKSMTINPEDQLSTEEMQMFESENEQLFNELSSLSEEMRQIESKVVKISELQEQFTEKVLEQEKDIERIASHVVGSTENVKDANEQIRQAIQRNAGLRVWILFFLLVMSFSLLFLDWYNE